MMTVTTVTMNATARRTKRNARCAIVVVSLLLGTRGALAGEGSDLDARAASAAQAPAKPTAEAERRARRAFEDAEAHFHAGLFAEALGEYQAGYDAAALPGFLINIAQCQRRLGDLTRARATYRKFIMVAPDSPFVPQVRALIADLDKLANDLDETNGAASATANAGSKGAKGNASQGALAGAAPPPAVASLAPKADSSTANPTLIGTTSSTTASAPGKTRKWWWVAGAVGVAAVVAGTVTIFATRSGDTTTLHEGTLGTLRR